MRKLLLFFIILIFVYFRIVPIINQTVPYTFDQGRDFLKVEEIVRYKNPTFIGPTTGIAGIYHGAWWYYFLSVPYILFRGNPIGFPFFIFIITLLQVFLFYLFLQKEFNFLTAIFFLIIIAISPYFISTSFFVISSVQVLPLILLLLYSTYQFFKTNKVLYQFLIFLSLGFIFEAEVPFGVFIVPAYFITIVLTREIKKFISNKKNVFYSFMGLVLPFIPRILFEIKHGFIQTKTALSFLLKPSLHAPKSLRDIFFDRLNLFWFYFKSLFPDNNQSLAIIILILSILGILYGYKKLAKLHKQYLNFILTLITFLFLLSLLYKDSFWPNYYEGISYFYVILLSIGVYVFSKQSSRIIKIMPFVIFIVLLAFCLQKFYQGITNKKNPPLIGLRVHLKTIDYLYEQNKNREFCVRIYTPPVIPYTYNYLFSYYSKNKGYPNPATDFIEGKCWYIVEDDQYKFRIEKWRKENIPQTSRRIKQTKIGNDVNLELWQEKK